MQKPYWMKSMKIVGPVPGKCAVEIIVVFRRWAVAFEMLRSVHKSWSVPHFWKWPVLYWRVFWLAVGWWVVGEIRI
jgi:hypothetical protein